MKPRFTIKFPEATLRDVVCVGCGHEVRYTRDELGQLLKTTLFHDNCPKCKQPYYDWTPEPAPTNLSNEFTKFGHTVHEVMRRRGEADDVALSANIGFVLLSKEESQGLASFSAPERYIYAVQAMIREVNNGGFGQFFNNTSGALAFDLVPALTAIGSAKARSIAERAVALFGRPRSLSEAARSKHLAKLTRNWDLSPWEDLDNEYYDEMMEPLESMMLDYIAGQQDAFAS